MQNGPLIRSWKKWTLWFWRKLSFNTDKNQSERLPMWGVQNETLKQKSFREKIGALQKFKSLTAKRKWYEQPENSSISFFSWNFNKKIWKDRFLSVTSKVGYFWEWKISFISKDWILSKKSCFFLIKDKNCSLVLNDLLKKLVEKWFESTTSKLPNRGLSDVCIIQATDDSALQICASPEVSGKKRNLV